MVISGLALLATLAWLIPAMQKTFLRANSETLASFADGRTPIMQERMQTLISASQRASRDSGVDRIMLDHVAMETDGLIDQFDPQVAAEESSFKRPLLAVAAGVVVWLLMAVFIGGDLGILLGRFLAPTSVLTRFQVNGIPGDAVVARGEPFTLELTGKGASLPVGG